MKIIRKTSNLNSNTHQSSYISQINTPVMTRCLLSVAVVSSLLLVGCGNDDKKIVTYSTTVKPISEFNKSQIDNGFGLQNTATPAAKCDIKIEKVTYLTKGAAGESTNATAALMLPSGDSADCQGDRPILLYAHGTTTEKAYDFSQVGNPENPAAAEATLIAANFAAQGYIVVAPNYAGYDESNLDYHPYLVAEQQSTDMVDALEGARAIIKQQQRANNANYTAVKDSGKLFLSGYSQGGHVVMATARLLEQQNKPVTAIAPSSGPYALAAFGDAIFAGNVNIGATAFAPLLANGFQKKYGNIYTTPTDIFTPQYAGTKLPNSLSFEDLLTSKKLPLTALFQTSPTGIPELDAITPEEGFGFEDKDYLIQTSFRAFYLADAKAKPDGLLVKGGNALPAANPENNLRKALKANDLRSYIPTMPTLICGGNQDPTVFYDLNTGAIAALLQVESMKNLATNLNVTVLDIDATNADKRDQNTLTTIGQSSMNTWDVQMVIENVQAKFASTVQQVMTNAYTKAYQQAINNKLTPEEANDAGLEASQFTFLSTYHGGLVSTSCTEATREFFDQNFINVAKIP